MLVTMTRADLERMSVKQPENKEQTVSRIVHDFKDRIVNENAKGETSTELLLYDNRPEIESKVIERLQEIFVDVDIDMKDVGLCKMLCFNWEIAPSEKVTTETEPESDNIIKKITMEVADEYESDDDPLEINLHIVVSNSRNIICGIRSEAEDNRAFSKGRLKGVLRKMEIMTVCMTILSLVMSSMCTYVVATWSN